MNLSPSWKMKKLLKTCECRFSFWEARITPITNYKWKCKEYSMIKSCAYITLYNNFKWVWKNPGLSSDAYWDWKHSVLCVDSRLGSSWIMCGAFQYKADERFNSAQRYCPLPASTTAQSSYKMGIKSFSWLGKIDIAFCCSCLSIFKCVFYGMGTGGKKYKSR